MILINSCNSNNYKKSKEYKYLEQTENFETKKGEWSIEKIMPNGINESLIDFELEKKDTLKGLRLIIDETKKQIIDESMFITVKLDSIIQRIELKSDYDTLYIYNHPIDDKYDITFIVGKYYYMYRTFDLNLGQELFFEKHEDSLKRIRGNELPKLPELDYSKDSIESIL